MAIDTGTTLIGGPPTVIRRLYEMIPGALPATGDYLGEFLDFMWRGARADCCRAGYYSYPCELRVNISMGFGGVVRSHSRDSQGRR